MKKFSVLSLFMFIFGICACISCGYLISTALTASSLFQATSSVSCEKQTIYAISIGKSKSENEVKSQKQDLQSQNGAGYIYNANDYYYLIASIYENMNDAELVKNNLKTNGVEGQIINIEIPAIKIEGDFSSDEKTTLASCLKSDIDIFKKLYDIAISLDTGVFDKTRAKLECNNVYSNHISIKTNFETLFKNQTSENINFLQKKLNADNAYLSDLILETLDTQSQNFSSLIKLTYCKVLLD